MKRNVIKILLLVLILLGVLYDVCYADVMPYPYKPYVPQTPEKQPVRIDYTPIIIGVVVVTIVVISIWVLIQNKEDKIKEEKNEKEEDNK